MPHLSYSPGSISTIFSPYYHKDILKTGSLGLSFTVNEGVACSIEESSESQMLLNNELISIASVDYVVKTLTSRPLKIAFDSPLKIGTGFGVSAACALSAAYAINRFFDLGKEEEELLYIAHAGDATMRTGLSDVITQFTGGVILRYRRMDPFTVKKISGFTHVPIYAHILDKLDTQSILEDTELSSKIKKTGDSLIGMLERNGVNSLEELMGYSYIFAEDSQLLYHASLDTILKEINADGSIATMIMLGKSFFSLKIIPGLSLKHLKISNERTYYL